ncbi:MAG: DUF4097 domain-containing protein [Candidatus Sericytochromatia bacterium]
MSEERKLILKMLQENRITVDEADTLLEALMGKTGPAASPSSAAPPPPAEERISGENIMKQMGPSIENFMGSVSNLIGSVTSQLGPNLEKTLDGIRQNVASRGASAEENTSAEISSAQKLALPSHCTKAIFHNAWGDIEVTSGESATEIIALLEKKPMRGVTLLDNALDAIQLQLKEEGQIAQISLAGLDLLKSDQIKVHVKLQVPAALHLELSTQGQDISLVNLSHVQGECHLKSHSGDLRVDQVALKTLELETQSGTIRADQISEQLKATSRSGDILLKGSLYQASLNSASGYLRIEAAVAHSLKAESQSADISLQLLEGKGKLDLQTTSGDIEISGRLQAETSLNSASGDLQGDLSIAPSAAVSLISNSGDIDLIVRPDSQCKLDVASRSGDVECRLSLEGQEVNEHFLQGRIGNGEGTLTARTNSGDVLIS